MSDFFDMNELGTNDMAQTNILSFEEQFDTLKSGLLYPSESDYELSYFSIDGEIEFPININIFKKLTGSLPKTHVESFSYTLFFDRVLNEQEWWTEYEKNRAVGFAKIKELIESNLTDIEFIRVGKTEIQAYIIGKSKEGICKGFKTIIIET